MPYDNNNHNSHNLLNQNNAPKTPLHSSFLPEAFIRTGKRIGILSMEFTVLQAPKPDNHNIAICHVEIETNDNRKAADFGCASPEMTGSDNPIALLEAARNQAAQRALSIAGTLSTSTGSKSYQEPEKNIFDVQPQVNQKIVSVNPPATQFHHSRKNPMSLAQSNALNSMAEAKGLTLEQMVRDSVGKNVSDMTSYDANMLMQQLKAMP